MSGIKVLFLVISAGALPRASNRASFRKDNAIPCAVRKCARWPVVRKAEIMLVLYFCVFLETRWRTIVESMTTIASLAALQSAAY